VFGDESDRNTNAQALYLEWMSPKYDNNNDTDKNGIKTRLTLCPRAAGPVRYLSSSVPAIRFIMLGDVDGKRGGSEMDWSVSSLSSLSVQNIAKGGPSVGRDCK
jgi:hypothetical protein